MTGPPPSGDQHVIVSGDQQVTVVEVGGGLWAFTVAGEPVLDGYEVDEMARGGRGQLLLPWPNRIRDGRYRFEGEDLQVGGLPPRTGRAVGRDHGRQPG